MKRLLSAATVLACLVLSGCAIVPAGPYYGYGRGAVVVAPVIAVPPPVVVRPYRRYDEDWGRYGRDGRGRGDGRRGY